MKIKRSKLKELAIQFIGNDSIKAQNEILIKIATAHCARVSYTVVGEEGKAPNYENDIKLHDRLLLSGHASPMEHIAQCQDNSNRFANFKGFKQYRTILEEQ
jgi:hypothetical protein